jgi:hypothetical protein
MFTCEIPFLAAQSGYGDGALPFEKPDHRGYGVLRGNRYTPMHMVRHQVPIQNLAPFLPGQATLEEDVTLLNGQTSSSLTGQTSGLP